MTLRGRVHGRTIEFDEPLPFEEGQVINVSVTSEGGESDRGTGAAILKALSRSPRPDDETMDEFERVLQEAKRPINFEGMFDDER